MPEIFSSDFRFSQTNYFSLKSFNSLFKTFSFAFIRYGLNVNLAQDIFGDNEQNYWDLWIQRVPDLGDTEEWSVRLIK